MKGDKPPLDSYLRRYLVGAVDLFPYVIPGLLGWIVAARNENNQRLGDLSADTVVVDATATLGAVPQTTTTVIRPTTEAARGEGEGTRSAPEDRAEMVDVEEALAGHTQTDMSEDDYPVLDLEDTASPIPTVERDDAIPSLIESSAGSKFVASLNDHEESVLADGETVEELPEKTYAENWHFPEAQEAPVWTPEPSTNKGPRAAANDAEQATPVSAPIPEPETKSSASPSATGDPVWNEEWQAWLYWDREGKKWLRHDPDKGWLPIGDSQKA